MGIIFYGAKQTPIDVDETMMRCPHCNSDQMADIMVISRYYHIYWIPMFPFEKLLSATCQRCGMFRGDLYFNKNLLSNFEEIKLKFRHPWFTYIGAGLFALMLLSIIIGIVF